MMTNTATRVKTTRRWRTFRSGAAAATGALATAADVLASNIETGESCGLLVTTRWERAEAWWWIAAPALAVSVALIAASFLTRRRFHRLPAQQGRIWGLATGVLLAGFVVSACTLGFAMWMAWAA